MDSGAAPRFTRILLTGPPGIGKTTICKKLIEGVRRCNRSFDGFYTEEIRGINKTRVGFDVIPIKNPEERVPLARIETASDGKYSKIRVGNYQVFIDNFERVALPTLQGKSDLTIIDEIGKMELFSESFYEHVDNLFFKNANRKMCIIATIPAKDRCPQRYTKFFQKFYHDSDCKVYEVNHQNRNELPQQLIDIITKMIN